ncbi:MAG TPA: hypothetical protein VEJ67_04970 [Candidatus Cybelea sp.]|nr:hypothetical protein [Candidatus Cybelea sp.]
MNSLRSLAALVALLFVVGISAAYADGINGRGDGDRTADVTSHVTAMADVNTHSFVGHEPVNGIRDGYALRVAMWQSHNDVDTGTSTTATPEQPTLLLLVAGVGAVFFLRRRALES